MKVTYYKETDTLYVELRSNNVHETREIDENTYLDLDATGQMCAITIEHASERADTPFMQFEQVETTVP